MAQRTHQANAPTSGQQVSLIRPGIAAVKLDENLCMSCCGHQQQEKASRTMTIARQWMEQPTVGSAFGMQFIIVRFCKKIYINLCIICIIYTYYIYILYYYIYTYIRIYSLFVFWVDASWIWICPLVGSPELGSEVCTATLCIWLSLCCFVLHAPVEQRAVLSVNGTAWRHPVSISTLGWRQLLAKLRRSTLLVANSSLLLR